MRQNQKTDLYFNQSFVLNYIHAIQNIFAHTTLEFIIVDKSKAFQNKTLPFLKSYILTS
jgi:hypothetical protein